MSIEELKEYYEKIMILHSPGDQDWEKSSLILQIIKKNDEFEQRVKNEIAKVQEYLNYSLPTLNYPDVIKDYNEAYCEGWIAALENLLEEE